MSNFGFPHLRVVNPYELAFREAQSAVGAEHILAKAREFTSVADAVADCSLVIGTTAIRHRELQHPLRHLAKGSGMMRKALRSEQVALLFGSEKRGLSNDDLSHCHWLLHIPTQDKRPSMNLGQAVAVTLYEISRSSATKAENSHSTRARSADLERISSLLLELLRVCGYAKPRSEVAVGEKTRRLVRRMQLTSEDATTVLGMLRKIAWKANRQQE